MERETFKYPNIDIILENNELLTDDIMNASGPKDYDEIRIGNR